MTLRYGAARDTVDRASRIGISCLGALVLALSVGCGSGNGGSGIGGGDQTAVPAPTLSRGVAATESTGTAAMEPGSEVPAGTPPSPGATTETIASGSVIKGNPDNYLSLVRTLKPGDTLMLEAGDYDDAEDVPGLPLFNVNGTRSKPITITGPESGPRPRLLGRATHNTVRLDNSSHLIIRNLEIDGRDLGAAAVAAQGSNHHITLENLRIHGVGNDQQTVGISTVSAPNWNWTIRGNTILDAGTGIYLGNSDGENAFIAGLIENNLIRDTIGYNLQIKHQNPRPSLAGMPIGKNVTVIRHNVFSKGSNSSSGNYARPNVLIGHYPISGPGSEDHYEIYGNLFWQNPTEALFQGEGNFAMYANIMASSGGAAINVQPHHDVPRTVRVFGNTIIAKASGISITGGHASHVQRAEGNAVFSDLPISTADQQGNVTEGYAQAAGYLNNPLEMLGRFDAFPKQGTLVGPTTSSTGLSAYSDWDRDFNGLVRDWTLRGAYSGQGANPGWKPELAPRPR